MTLLSLPPHITALDLCQIDAHLHPLLVILRFEFNGCHLCLHQPKTHLHCTQLHKNTHLFYLTLPLTLPLRDCLFVQVLEDNAERYLKDVEPNSRADCDEVKLAMTEIEAKTEVFDYEFSDGVSEMQLVHCECFFNDIGLEDD